SPSPPDSSSVPYCPCTARPTCPARGGTTTQAALACGVATEQDATTAMMPNVQRVAFIGSVPPGNDALTGGDGRCDAPPSGTPGRRGCRSRWSPPTRAPATPGRREGRLRPAAGGWRTNAGG